MYEETISFLEYLRPGGPWLLLGMLPDAGGSIVAVTTKDAAEVVAFVRQHNGTRNLYYGLNPTRGPMTKKAAKTDIAAIEYLPADLDPKSDETPDAAKARYLAALESFTPK